MVVQNKAGTACQRGFERAVNCDMFSHEKRSLCCNFQAICFFAVFSLSYLFATHAAQLGAAAIIVFLSLMHPYFGRGFSFFLLFVVFGTHLFKKKSKQTYLG